MYYKVLIVDDEEIVCSGMRAFLNWEEMGFSVVSTANSVAQALVYLESNDVDLVISDIRMPVQNGLQLLEAIREEYPDVKFIVLSAYGDFSYAQQAIRLGALDFLTKPVDFKELRDLLSQLRLTLDNERRQLHSLMEYKRLRQESLLNGLSKGYLRSLGEEQSGEWGLAFDGRFQLLRVCLENSGLSYDELNLRKKRVEELTEALLGRDGAVYAFNNELRETAILFFPRSGTSAEEQALELSSQLARGGIKAVIGISDLLEGMASVKTGYAQAGRALQYKMIKPQSPVIQFREIGSILFWEGLANEETITRLLELVSGQGGREEVLTLICGWIDSVSGGAEAAHSEVYALCVQIMLMISSHLSNCVDEELGLCGAPYAIIRRLLLCGSVSEAKGIIAEYVDELYKTVEGLGRPAACGNIINHIKQYIGEHYAEDVSLNSLADMFYIHPVYLSRLFKERTGINFIDYITDVRISKAKEFLQKPSYRICDVSQMVGYESPRYFSKLFKSISGMTPKEYRDM